MNMRIFASIKVLSYLLALATVMFFPLTASAAKLPNGTLLSMNPGVVVSNSCISGSCFRMEIVKGFPVWTALEAGTDGGLILGKNQLSGGQEIGIDSSTNVTPGQATAAFNYFASYGTFGTAPMTGTLAGVVTSDSSLNYFNDASCSGAACVSLTKLGTLNVAWSGTVAPMGSEGGCLSANCTAAQLSGIFISNWTVNTDKTYALEYSQIVPDGHASGFGGTPFTLLLSGTITAPGTVVNLPPVANNVLVEGAAAQVLTWTPVVSDADNGPSPMTCAIGTPPANGTATVAANCSSGSYLSGIGFSGIETFTYTANDGLVNSNAATVTAATTGSPSTACTLSNPIRQVVYDTKNRLSVTVTGNISSTTNRLVYICPASRLEYDASSRLYPVTCYINGVVAAPKGFVNVGALLKCDVKPYSGQNYRLNIISAI